jgi:hypothetical protein
MGEWVESNKTKGFIKIVVDLLLMRRQGTVKSEFRGFSSPMSSANRIQKRTHVYNT